MAHQSEGGFGKAGVTKFSPETHHDKPEEHKEDDDFPRSLEEALLGE